MMYNYKCIVEQSKVQNEFEVVFQCGSTSRPYHASSLGNHNYTTKETPD